MRHTRQMGAHSHVFMPLYTDVYECICVYCWHDGAIFSVPVARANSMCSQTEQIVQYTYGGAAYRYTNELKSFMLLLLLLLFAIVCCLLVIFTPMNGFCFQFALILSLFLSFTHIPWNSGFLVN